MTIKSVKQFACKTLAMVGVLAIVGATGIMPVMAAETVNGTSTTFNKYLVMKEQANVPEVTFEFDIEAISLPEERNDDTLVAETRDANGAVVSPRVYATGNIEGLPTVTESVTFLPGDTTYNTVQEGDALSLEFGSTFTLEDGYKYAKKELTLDFSAVEFTKPGIFRYKLTEKETTNDGVTSGSLVRYCDVYVNQNPASAEEDLEIQGYCIHESEDKVPEKAFTYWNDYATVVGEGELKDNGFENLYTTYDLTIQKKITGNHGYKGEYFQFKLEIDGVLPNSRYDLVLDNATSENNTNDACVNSRTEGNETVYYLQADEEGKVEYTFYLSNKGGNEEFIKVLGLTSATTYKVSEVCEDYDPSWVITLDSATDGSVKAQKDLSAEFDEAYAMGEDDNTVVFTNNREVSVMTGVATKIAPLAVTLALGVGAIVAVAASKKRKWKQA